MTRIFTLLFATIFAGAASAQTCFPLCDTGQWKSAKCGTLCTVGFWKTATAVSVQQILANGATVDSDDGRGWEALHYAALFGTPDTVAALLEAGADPDGHYATNNVVSPLHLVVDPRWSLPRSDVSRLRYSIIPGGDDVSNERTPQQKAEIIAKLISAGAQINAVNDSGKYLLYYSVRYSDIDTLRQLLEAGADVNTAEIVDNFGNRGRTPLHYVYNLEIFELLVNAGADLDAMDADGTTALYWHISGKSVPITLALIEVGARVDIASTKGETPLHILAKVTKRHNFHRQTIAEYAASETEIAKLLLEHGAQIDAVTNTGLSPMETLHSVGGESSNLAKIFVEWGAEEVVPTLEKQRICTLRTRKGTEVIEIETPCPTE